MGKKTKPSATASAVASNDLLEDIAVSVMIIQRRLEEAYGDDSRLIVSPDGVSLDGPNGEILINNASAEAALARLMEDAANA